MKIFKTIFIAAILIVLGAFTTQKPVLAQMCRFESGGGTSLNYVTGGFDSREDARNHAVRFDCVNDLKGNCGANWLSAIRARFTRGTIFSYSDLPDSQIWTTSNGKYETGVILGQFDASVYETYNRCAEPIWTDNMVEPGCLTTLTIGTLGALPSGGISLGFLVAGGTAACSTAAAHNAMSVIRNECDVKFLAEVKDGRNIHCSTPFTISSTVDITGWTDYTNSGEEIQPFNACKYIVDPKLKSKCTDCMGIGDSKGVWTGAGCIDFNPKGFVTQFLQIAIGLGGGAAFLSLIFGAFLFTTSAGDPKAAENAQNIITGATIGLLMIIFSVVILEFIGVKILQLPGF